MKKLVEIIFDNQDIAWDCSAFYWIEADTNLQEIEQATKLFNEQSKANKRNYEITCVRISND